MAKLSIKGVVSSILRLGFILMAILLLIFLLLQLPPIQNWITSRVVHQVTKSTDLSVDIGTSAFDMNKGVSLENVLIQGSSGDSLLILERLSVSPRGTLLSLISGSLSLNQISLTGVDVRLSRKKDQLKFNWEEALTKDETSTSNTKEDIIIDISRLSLRDFRVTLKDDREGKYANAFLKGFDVDIKQLRIGDSTIVDINRLILDEPKVLVGNWNRSSNEIDDANDSTKSKSLATLSKLINVSSLAIVNGYFEIENLGTHGTTLREVDLLFSDFHYTSQDDWETRVEDLAFRKGQDDFKYIGIEKAVAKNGIINLENVQVNLNDALVKLDASIIDPTSWDNWEDIEAEVTLRPSYLKMSDIANLVPNLNETFGRDQLFEEELQLSGVFRVDQGRINAQEVLMWFAQENKFTGSFSFESAEEFTSSLLTANVEELHLNVPRLNTLSDNIRLPKELVRLGNIDFNGSYDGFINDFVATGELRSDIGDAYVDIQFDLSGEGDESWIYEGALRLDSFDLARFTLNDDFGYAFGKIDITDGIGPDLSNSSAKIEASIPSIVYKGYTYKNANYKGELSSKVVNGRFEIKDEDVDFTFQGIADVSDSIPVFDFNIVANYINFCNLNLLEFPCEVSFASDISFKGSSASRIQGRGILGDIVLKSDSTELTVEKIELISNQTNRGMKFDLKSDYLDFNIEGKFNLSQIVNATLDQVLTNTAQHNSTWKVKRKVVDPESQDYSYKIKLKDATPVFEFLSQEIRQDGVASIEGEFHGDKNVVNTNARIPSLKYKEWSAKNIKIDLGSRSEIADVLINMDSLSNGSISLESAYVSNNLFKDEMQWAIYGRSDSVDVVSLSGRSRATNEGYFTEFIEHNIVFDSTQWTILPNDGFGIFPKRLDIAGVTMTDGAKFIKVSDYNNKGLSFGLNDFDLSLINPIINYEPLYFEGGIDGEFVINDLYDDRSIQGFLEVDDFTINQDSFGVLSIKTKRASNGVVDLDLSITKDSQNLYAIGYADIENSNINFNVEIEKYPMSFFEYIIEEGISQTEGTTDVNVKVSGTLDDLKMDGQGVINSTGVRIDYTGAYYTMDKQLVTIDESFIDFTGVTMVDAMGNTAQIKGGLRHNLLADIRADLNIKSDDVFIGLNTTEEDNLLYYGLGVGEMEISFNGPFDAIDIRMTAECGNLSQLFIPITNNEYGYDESFIIYDYEDHTIDSSNEESIVEQLKRQGVDFEMNLTFTPEAEVLIIYDQETNNILRGRGEGAIRLRAKRDGEFTVYGDYNVGSGDYLYTGYGAIAKPFDIQPGGTVIWTGDPVNASINVSAKYPTLRVPLTEFLSEYRGVGAIQEGEFNQRREVDLTLLIDGTLFNPNINFDINFPNLIGPIRPLALSKVRTLRSTENGLNNQVVGLMVFGNFLPDNNPLADISGERIGQTGTTTVTQFITSQLSLLFTEYLSKQLSEDGFITGIDFDIALAKNNSIFEGTGNVFDGLFDIVPDEVQVNVRNRFKNENLVLNVGGNYVRNNQIGTGNNYVTGDFSLDWYLTEDKRLKLQFYSNFGFDEVRISGRQRYGMGINYRKEFGTITDFEAVIDDIVKEIQEADELGEKSN